MHSYTVQLIVQLSTSFFIMNFLCFKLFSDSLNLIFLLLLHVALTLLAYLILTISVISFSFYLYHLWPYSVFIQFFIILPILFTFFSFLFHLQILISFIMISIPSFTQLVFILSTKVLKIFTVYPFHYPLSFFLVYHPTLQRVFHE